MNVEWIPTLVAFVVGRVSGYIIRELNVSDAQRLHIRILELENERLKQELEVLKNASREREPEL